MENPWLQLRDAPEYVLDIDKSDVEQYDARQSPRCKLIRESIPEPWIGNPDTATVVLLLLNPGHSPDDKVAHREPSFKRALMSNLRREPQDYPFYPLNPQFQHSPSARWWAPRLRSLLSEAGIAPKALSKKLLAIEWFPYHSPISGLPSRRICASQDYTFDLASQMLSDHLVLMMRSAKHWTAVDPGFARVPMLKNPRAAYISRGNMEPEQFERVIAALS